MNMLRKVLSHSLTGSSAAFVPPAQRRARPHASGCCVTCAAISTSNPRPVFDTRFQLGESPIWDADNERLIWVDQEGKRIHVLSPSDGAHSSVPTNALTPAVILTPDPNILVVPKEQQIVEIDLSKGGEVRRVLATVPTEQGDRHDGTWRFNDSRAAPGGQIIAGRMPEEKWDDGVGGWVYMLQPPSSGGGGNGESTGGDAKLSVLFEQGAFGLPNGIAWNLDKKTVYYNDTYKGKVWAIPCDDAGTPDTSADWRTVVTLDADKDGSPDGLAIDVDGNLWVAQESGGKVCCYDAESGERLHTIDMPCNRPSAVAFGGPNLQQLYITTIKGEDPSPESGKLFVVDVEGVAGAGGAHKYLG